MMADTEVLHIVSPLIESSSLTHLAKCHVYLKLENCQPTSSFKIRGIGSLCQKAKLSGKTRVVCSSGGNAGLAAAYACRHLGMECKIYVPQTTPDFTVSRLREQGAEVEVNGKIWDEANTAALSYLESHTDCAFVHPYDHPQIWTGHSTMIDEIKQQTLGKKPGCIVTSVGGGGLLTGIIQGLDAVGWSDVPIVAMETHGAASLAASMKSGTLVTIPDITSIAKSLGSRTVCQQLFDYTKTHRVISQVLPDRDAMSACIRFTDDHRMLVEPACGVSLAFIYSGLISKLQDSGTLPDNIDSIVIIVCGGSSVTMDTINNYKTVLLEN